MRSSRSGIPLPGVVLPFWLNRPPLEAVEIARLAEEGGFPELWLGEMLHFDAFGLAGYIAGMTSRIQICVGPLAVGVRDPVLVGRGISTVSVLAGRAARLALGGSTPGIVEGFHGRSWAAMADRMRETIHAVRQVTAGTKTSFEGDWVRTRGYRSALGPQRTHISVAAFGPRMIEVAARDADRMVLNLVTVEQAERLVGKLRRAATSAGRLPPPVTVWTAAAVDPSEETIDQIRAQIALYLAAPGYAQMFAGAGYAELVEQARGGLTGADLTSIVPDQLVKRVAAVGTRREVEDRLAEYRAVGAAPAVVPATAGDRAGRSTLAAISSASLRPAGGC